MHRREDLPLSNDLADTYNSVILNVVKNLKVSKRFQSRTDLETLHVVQGDTIISIREVLYNGRLTPLRGFFTAHTRQKK